MVLLAVLVAVYVAALGRLLPLAVDDFGLAAVYSTDEALSGQIVRRMLDGPTLSPGGFFAYGALYHELTALALIPFVPSGLGERGVLVGLRAVALAGGAATLLLTYLLGAQLYGRWAGLLAAALVACSPELAAWSVTAHPDTVQLAFLTGALLAVCAVRERSSRGRVALAALLAGLAFSTKYAGLLLLPLLGVAVAAGLVARGWWGRRLTGRLLADAALIGAVFAGVFVLTNPYAVVEWRRFLTQLRGELAHAREGHVLAEAASRWRWLGLVAARSFSGPLVPLAALAGWALALLAPRPSVAAERISAGGANPAPAPPPPGATGAATAGAVGVPRSPASHARATGSATGWIVRLAARLDGRVLLGVWASGYLLYLVAAVGYHAPRHALPVLPALAVLAAGAVAKLTAHRQTAGLAAGAALLLGTALLVAGPFRGLYTERLDRPADAARNPRVQAGRWLAATLPPDAGVLSDAYVYLPSGLHRAATTFGLTNAMVRQGRPVVIVTNEDIRGRFRDPALAERYVDGPAAYRERAGTYADLEAGTLGCYQLVREYGPVRIYADEAALRAGASQGCGLTP